MPCEAIFEPIKGRGLESPARGKPICESFQLQNSSSKESRKKKKTSRLFPISRLIVFTKMFFFMGACPGMPQSPQSIKRSNLERQTIETLYKSGCGAQAVVEDAAKEASR
jgi:hypothetical protein